MANRSASDARWLSPRLARVPAKTLAPAAIRIPERFQERPGALHGATPHLFIHEGARQSLERKLEVAALTPVAVSITDNQFSIISHTRHGGLLRVRLHHMFLDAPAKVVDALVRYITKGDRESSVRVGLYIEENGYRLVRRRRRIALHTRGKHHDLLSIFEEVKRRYFGGSFNALITWGGAGRRQSEKPRKVIRLGSYNAIDRIIRVHPVLDRAWVPRYFVAFVVYHEMLHQIFPTVTGTGRRELHPAPFMERERTFHLYDRASEWERNHVARLLKVG